MAGNKRAGIPKYSLHRATGQARVRLDGNDIYLGKFGTDESREAYARAVAEWMARKKEPPTTTHRRSLTVGELSLLFLDFAKQHYRRDGAQTKHIYSVRSSLRWLNKLYSTSLIENFGPLALRAIQEAMIVEGFARTYVNDTTNRIRRCFKWGVSKQLVPIAVLQALQTVPGLQAGRTAAKEMPSIEPVTADAINAALPFMPAQIKDLVRLQLLTGCRPGEIVIIRPCDIDRTGEVWQFRPSAYKTMHHGKARVILIGPKAQQILTPWLERSPEAYCFSAAEAKATWRANLAVKRKSKRTPSQLNRKPVENPLRAPKNRYTTASYGRAVARACLEAGIETWSVNQLRHSRATDIRQQFGIEAASTVLGHACVSTTEIYAMRDLSLASRVMAEIG